MKKNIFEVCVYNYQSAFNAQVAGADRIELCDNMYEGGTTPSYGMITTVSSVLKIDINVMIRPRGGDFCYDDIEYEIMMEDIRKCKELNVNGVVFGILKPDGNIDIEKTSQLCMLAKPMSVTFHRAFDMTIDLMRSLDELTGIGIDRVLTSGGSNTAIEGIAAIRRFVDKSQNRIIIMPGSGINAENIKQISEMTGANEFHMSGKMPVNSIMYYRKNGISMGGIKEIDEYQLMISDIDKIKETIQQLEYH
jgi:copper homeostasis protein